MKRADITALFPEATAEQIKALMDINGADINAAKQNAAELQDQLTAANEQIRTLQAGAASLEEVTKQAQAYSAELESLKAANTIRDMRAKVSKATGVPVELLTGDTEEACTAQAQGIAAFAKPTAYPVVKDGGEVHATQSNSPRMSFADWFNTISN